MARCDQGYLCCVCGEEVEHITESTLYLRYVVGELDPEVLHLTRESHLRCHPVLSQFILDARVGPLAPLDPEFSLMQLDPGYVAERQELLSRGYQRLWDIQSGHANAQTVHEYPLPEVIERWRNE